MKKSNWIVYGGVALVSIVLLWLWYYLEMYLIDAPADLIFVIVWWAVIAASIFLVHRVEQARKQKIRMLYVSEVNVFSPEVGMTPYQGPEQLLAVAGGTLEKLRYGFSRQVVPSMQKQPIKFLIKTKRYSSDTWTGEVQIPGEHNPQPFNDREELSRLINSLKSSQ